MWEVFLGWFYLLSILLARTGLITMMLNWLFEIAFFCYCFEIVFHCYCFLVLCCWFSYPLSSNIVIVSICQSGPRDLFLEFGQHWFNNSWDFPTMDKCCRDKFCLDICHSNSWNLFKMIKGAYVESFIKLG